VLHTQCISHLNTLNELIRKLLRAVAALTYPLSEHELPARNCYGPHLKAYCDFTLNQTCPQETVYRPHLKAYKLL
jgi:hypothetical protein